jgi:hypothetical protein
MQRQTPGRPPLRAIHSGVSGVSLPERRTGVDGNDIHDVRRALDESGTAATRGNMQSFGSFKALMVPSC